MAFTRSGPGGHDGRPRHRVRHVLPHPLLLAVSLLFVAIALLIGLSPKPASVGVENISDGSWLEHDCTLSGCERQEEPTPGDGRATPQITPGPAVAGEASEEVTSTIEVSGTFDGGGKRYHAGSAFGDGSRHEGQKPLFELAPGAVLRNVLLAAPVGGGVHCEGGCTLENIHWEDVDEDAARW